MVASVLFFAVVCWGSSIGASDTNRLNKLIKKAGSVIGCKQDTTLVERRTLNKLLSIMDNTLPLDLTLVRQRSTLSKRLLQLCCLNNRYRNSFLPQVITSYKTLSAHVTIMFTSALFFFFKVFLSIYITSGSIIAHPSVITHS